MATQRLRSVKCALPPRSPNGKKSTLLMAMGCALIVILMQSAQAQTLTVLHNFTDSTDGANPYAGLSMDAAGNLYGTASEAGYFGGQCLLGCGTVYKLMLKNSHYLFQTLYNFHGVDGNGPRARVILGPDGTLYGTTIGGG